MVEWTETYVVDDLKMRLVASKLGLRALQFHHFGEPEGERNDNNEWMTQAVNELRAYFAGKLHTFSVPLDMQGTEFQLSVWHRLCRIPYGETRSYAQIAEAVGRPTAVRAVGAANGSNPVAIIVPCHRVIGSNGKLTGYGGGLPMKKRLLELEGAWTMGLRL
ncbi:MAG TPA: methylated-DNA--[protein]-cysteine S-methyltransferase [Bryobacteraceae bacterium]|jgi:methylated-DNA-[protein]-cysteine S-methyltransferase|nr:methylated-DNA--[protein]-cysteine S-methyltransferase [Bryobacteraceae bacterium]